MSEWIEILNKILNLGVSGLLIYVGWRLADKWAGPFLAAQQEQAKAMGEMAAAVKDGQGQSGEILLAMRVVASKVDDVKRGVDSIATHGCAVVANKKGDCGDA